MCLLTPTHPEGITIVVKWALTTNPLTWLRNMCTVPYICTRDVQDQFFEFSELSFKSVEIETFDIDIKFWHWHKDFYLSSIKFELDFEYLFQIMKLRMIYWCFCLKFWDQYFLFKAKHCTLPRKIKIESNLAYIQALYNICQCLLLRALKNCLKISLSK